MKRAKTHIHRSRSNLIFDIVNDAIMVLVFLIMLYPIWFVIIASVSEPSSVAQGKVILWPDGFTWYSYINVFEAKKIWIGYRNTIFYTVAGTLLNLALTIPAAYTLSKKQLPGRKWLSLIFVFTMYFGGGMIPTYINMKNLHLLDSPLTLVIVGGLSVYNMIICRTYFQNSIPNDLYEAATIDGASQFQQFFKIALPLSGPITAVIALYYAVGRWNEYYNALIYLNNKNLMPLQMVLRDVLINGQQLLDEVIADPNSTLEELAEASRNVYMAEGMKYAVIFVSALPMLLIYPFVQKYFVKGVMIGSVKE